MKIYDSLTRQVKDFEPANYQQATLYTCGPTVYDYAHIGNLRAYVFDDTLRRALEYAGYNPKHVMNVTDVGHLVSDEDEGEDKLEKGAKREQKTVREVADFYIDTFLADVKHLNILPPNGYSGPQGNYARATDFIKEQIELVQLLIDKGFAYPTEQAIYFDVSKLDDYGKLTGQKLTDKEVAARSEVVSDVAKRNPQDFAVWFFAVGRFAKHSLHWPSPWGEGFPGWHLECSAIIHATLGEPIDIHTGGVDHIGTHHTNEIAQTEAAYGTDLASFWMHNEHLLVDGQKMSKSRGNYLTLRNLIDKGYDPLALRMLFLQSHYRSQTNFTFEALDGAQAFLKSLRDWADLKHQRQSSGNEQLVTEAHLEPIKHAVLNDLSTPGALALVSALTDEDTGLSPSQNVLDELDKLFGLGLAGRPDIDNTAKNLINARTSARDTKDWEQSDKLRQQLLNLGLEVNDTDSGPIWRRI